MGSTMLEREMKRGSAELLILALLEDRERHGYDVGKQIEERSDGTISFHITSLYPTLYGLERKGLIAFGKKYFARKGAKAQRKTLRNAVALCAFAPLRANSSREALFVESH